MRFLFIMDSLNWPRISGADVHCSQMMRALVSMGHEVGLGTEEVCSEAAVENIGLHKVFVYGGGSSDKSEVGGTWLQNKYRNYWGITDESILSIRSIGAEFQPDVIVTTGLGGLPFLLALPNIIKVWYAADEWFLHHLSLVKPNSPSTWIGLKTGLFRLVYERAYVRAVDRCWVVTNQDRIAMERLAGYPHVDLVPNGVDAEFYHPIATQAKPNSCVFWGRLDFEPNIQALQWFCENVWPEVIEKEPSAAFTICGYAPVDSVLSLSRLPGVTVKRDLPDIRAEVLGSQLAILPMVSGAGIKNKLLEAAALGFPIVCTKRACMGLRTEALPFTVAEGKTAWRDALFGYWSDAAKRREHGILVRNWVMKNHSWRSAATDALAGLNELIDAKRKGFL
jgi:glycosyltransferase involved in cell wall biosynthesis